MVDARRGGSRIGLIIGAILLQLAGAPLAARGGDSSSHRIGAWQTIDRAPPAPVYSMAQTPNGYLWLGTSEGVVRFDGLRFHGVPLTGTSFPANTIITTLHCDLRGNLWVGTAFGLAVREGAKWREIKFPGANGARGHHYVRSLTERPNGDLLATANDGGVFELREGKLYSLPHPPGDLARTYYGSVDDKGDWWVAQDKFVGKWDGQRWLETVQVTDIPDLARDSVRCIASPSGGLWSLLGSELRYFRDGTERRRLSLPGFQGRFSGGMEDSRGNVWICTDNDGLWRVNSDSTVDH